MNNLDRRIVRLEQKLAVSSGIPAFLAGWYKPIASHDYALSLGVNDDGEALISQYWSIWFLGGSKAEQEHELEVHRANSKYNQPPWKAPNWNESYVEYTNGGCVELIYEKFVEEEAELKRIAYMHTNS
jgi:hypothetical protein